MNIESILFRPACSMAPSLAGPHEGYMPGLGQRF